MKKTLFTIATFAILGLSMQQAQAQSCVITSYSYTPPTCYGACDGAASFTIPAACVSDTIFAGWFDNTICSPIATGTILPGATVYTLGGICGCSNSYNGIYGISFTNPSGSNYYGSFIFYTAPPVCVITTDSASNYAYNIISWDNRPSADSFIVYRFNNGTSLYDRLGAVSKHSLSEFKDTCRSIGGPNGGNPNTDSWKYAIQERDACGNYSVLGPAVVTNYLQHVGGNFNWTAYLDTSVWLAQPVTGYGLYRDTTATGNYFRLIATTTSIWNTSATDPTYSTYPTSAYRVDAFGTFNCNSTALRLAGGGNNSPDATRVRSHSNTSRQVGNGIKQYTNGNAVNIYPNPSNGSFVMEPNNTTKQTMQVYDVNGKMVLSQSINGKTSIDANSLNEGVYNISIISNEGVINKRLVIVR
ncbi:MAG TPA: T9SS type A sorting domain-containing protein [Bacteroidia bacterium]